MFTQLKLSHPMINVALQLMQNVLQKDKIVQSLMTSFHFQDPYINSDTPSERTNCKYPMVYTLYFHTCVHEKSSHFRLISSIWIMFPMSSLYYVSSHTQNQKLRCSVASLNYHKILIERTTHKALFDSRRKIMSVVFSSKNIRKNNNRHFFEVNNILFNQIVHYSIQVCICKVKSNSTSKPRVEQRNLRTQINRLAARKKQNVVRKASDVLLYCRLIIVFRSELCTVSYFNALFSYPTIHIW